MENKETATNRENEELGKLIRELRQNEGINIEELAHRSSLSLALISKIERGLINPTIQTIRKISRALNVPTAYFFARESNGIKQKASMNNKQIFSYPKAKVSYMAIMSKCSSKVRMFMIEAQPGAQGGDEALYHQGFEQGIVIEGSMELEIGGEIYILNENDTLSFPSSVPHKWRNIGEGVCRSIWAIYADYLEEEHELENQGSSNTKEGWNSNIPDQIMKRHQ